METRTQLPEQAETTENLARRIAALEQEQSFRETPDPPTAETLLLLRLQLEEAQQTLRKLRLSHDQQMLSQMVNKGPDNAETIAWWMNRY